MNNIERAGYITGDYEGAQDLYNEGLLAPELPAPNDEYSISYPTWSTSGTPVSVARMKAGDLRINIGGDLYITPNEAGQEALDILAAVKWARDHE